MPRVDDATLIFEFVTFKVLSHFETTPLNSIKPCSFSVMSSPKSEHSDYQEDEQKNSVQVRDDYHDENRMIREANGVALRAQARLVKNKARDNRRAEEAKNALPHGVFVDWWSEGSTRNLNPRRHFFIAYKLNKELRCVSYGATIYTQKNRDLLNERAHFETALYRLEILPLTVEDAPDWIFEDNSREKGPSWFISGLLLTLGCYDRPQVGGPSPFPMKTIKPHTSARYQYNDGQVVKITFPRARAQDYPDTSDDDSLQSLRIRMDAVQATLAQLNIDFANKKAGNASKYDKVDDDSESDKDNSPQDVAQ